MPTLRVKLKALPSGPGAPTGLTVTATIDGVTISGTAPAGTLVRLYEDNALVDTAAAPGAFSFTRNPEPGEHVYVAQVFDAGTGRSSASGPVTVVRPRRAKPDGLTATAFTDRIEVGVEPRDGVTGGRLTVTRQLDVDTGKVDETTGEPIIQQEAVAETTNLAPGVIEYVDTTSLPGRLTTYTWVWLDADGYASEPAETASSRPIEEVDDEAPAAPWVISATYDGTTIVIALSPPTDDPTWIGHTIERRPAGGGETSWETRAETVTAASWVDSPVDPTRGYDYRLRAWDNAGLHSGYTAIDVRPTVVPVPPVIDDLYVAVTGSDASDGETAGTAFRTPEKAMTRLRPGVTILIGPGTYHAAMLPQISGTPDKPITIKAQTPGTVIFDGQLTLARMIDLRKRPFVIVEGIEFTNYFSGYFPGECAVAIGADCTVRDCFGHHNVGGAFGLDLAHRAIVEDCRAEDNGMDGFQGGGGNGWRISRCTWHRNGLGHSLNQARYEKDQTAGTRQYAIISPGKYGKNHDKETAKFSRANGFTFEDCAAGDNLRGKDLWFDIGLKNGRILRCSFDTTFVEISLGPILYEDCIVRRFMGIWESSHVTIEGGTYGNSSATDMVIQLRDGDQSRGYYDPGNPVFQRTTLHDVTIMRARIEGGHIKTGGSEFVSPTAAADLRILIDYITMVVREGAIVLYFGGYNGGRCYSLLCCWRKGLMINSTVELLTG
jgi:hypothetical protein